jgi:hypothetical protein
VLSVRINHLVKPFLLQAYMSLFPTFTEYFIYSHLPYFLYIAAMLYCSGDEEYFMKTSSRRAKPSVIFLWQDGVLSAA